MIKVSVIMVTYNAEKYITSSLENIKNIKKKYNIEFIVVDGLSKDDTIRILQENRNIIDKLIIEPDKGIYDAMNKGIKMVSGEYYIFIGSDDKLINIPVEKLERAYKERYMLVAGNVDMGSYIFNSSISLKTHIKNTIHHQGLFYNKNLSVSFNTKYRIFSDFDLNQKFYKNNVSILFINDVISKFNSDGVSTNNKFNLEQSRIVMENYGVLWAMLSVLHLLYAFIKCNYIIHE